MKTSRMPRVEIAARSGLRSDVSQRAMSLWARDVRAAEGDDTTISILDVIGENYWDEGVTVKRISGALRQIGARPVTVAINSPGGDMFEGLAIYNLLRDHPAPVTVKIIGIAASAASVIAMAGDDVQIARAGFLMIHNSWVIASGNRHDMREVADWLEPFDAAMVDVYAARSGVDPAEIARLMDAESYLSGQQSVDRGFADGLLPRDAVGIDPADDGASALRAERQIEIMARRAGVSRSDARSLLAELKSGRKRGAAPTGGLDAAALNAELAELRALLTHR